jgi:hypothetical protein
MILRWPLPPEHRRITQYFGENPAFYRPFGLDGHEGLDVAAAVGTPVTAMHSGVVTVLSAPASYGRYVIVECDWMITLYGHLSRALRDGEIVPMGALIGYSGNTGGTSTGAHLHIGVKPKPVDQNNGYKGWVDPLPLLQEGERMEAIRKAATGVRWEIEEIERLLIEAEQHDNTVIAERAMAERCRRQARQKLQALISTKNGNAYRVEGLLGGPLPKDWEGT